MANSYRNVAGQNPEDVYDPDVMGDGPVAAIGGIGYRNAAGQLLKFAAKQYGSAAPNHGYRIADGRDFSALWAKKGTASYALPINGQTFEASGQALSGQEGTITATAQFGANSDGTYSVIRSGTNGGSSVLASGSWRTQGGASSDYQIQFTLTVGGTSGTGSTGNTATTYTSLAAGQAASVTCTCPASAPTTYKWTYGLRIRIKRVSTGVVISDTTITLSAVAGGMV